MIKIAYTRWSALNIYMYIYAVVIVLVVLIVQRQLV